MTNRRGIVLVSASLMQNWDVSLTETDLQGQLRADGVFERLEKKLLLPECMHIEAVYFRWQHFNWELLVSSPTFAEVPDTELLPFLHLIYRRVRDEVELVRIDVLDRPQRYLQRDLDAQDAS